MGHRSRPELPHIRKEPPWWPITCWHLAERRGGGYWEVCKHSAERDCDLRVVGLTDYGLREPATPRYPKRLPPKEA